MSNEQASVVATCSRLPRAGRRWGRCIVLASLPLSSEAYQTIGLTSTQSSGGLGPIHLLAGRSSFVAEDSPAFSFPPSVGGGGRSRYDRVRVSSHRPQGRTRMSITATTSDSSSCAASIASSYTIVPSSYLARRGPRRLCVPGGPAADRYGGRAWGSGGVLPPDTPGTCSSEVASGGRTALGFVIDDADGIGSTTASSSPAASDGATTSTELGMVSFLENEAAGGASADEFENGKKKDSGGERGNGHGGIRTVSAATSSPLKKRVAESLLGMSLEEGAFLKEFSSAAPPKLRVPAWFPWLPTKDQIRELECSELREACAERGLDKFGNKKELRGRLQDWTRKQHERRVLDRRVGLTPTTRSSIARSPLDDMIDQALPPGEKSGRGRGVKKSSSPSVGESDLFSRRRELRRSKYYAGKAIAPEVGDDDEVGEVEDQSSSSFASTDENRAALTKLFQSAPAKYSNIDIQKMYKAAKIADKNGDRPLARSILTQLREATPNDSRVVRRLARLEMEEGDIVKAREVLRDAIRANPKDAYLHQGLAQVELRAGNDDAARMSYREAIRSDPCLPNPYHALGTLEHSRGNIRAATTVLRTGLKMCPTNHRLHLALGDLYREARMLDVAEVAYRRVLEYAPESGKSFGYAALAYLSYERGDMVKCRQWLHEAVEANGGRHSQGWLALANLEESEGRIDDAREVYTEAAIMYERRKVRRSFVKLDDEAREERPSLLPVGSSAKRSGGTRKVVRPSLSGDKWIFLYRSWARMEEHHGTFENADKVYRRATNVFPNNAALVLDRARLHAGAGQIESARILFERACRFVSGEPAAKPYRLYAEFEMSRGDLLAARSILYRGAQALSETRSGSERRSGEDSEPAHLYHTWALAEWHLNNLDRTEVLFDHALRLIDAGQSGSSDRSLVLYSIARFLYGARNECVLAQHCVCLSLKEDLSPGIAAQIWRLWADIATDMGNADLAEKCVDQANRLEQNETEGDTSADLSRLLGLWNMKPGEEGEGTTMASLPMITGPTMQQMLRREPWHHKIVGTSPKSKKTSWYGGVPFPETSGSKIVAKM